MGGVFRSSLKRRIGKYHVIGGNISENQGQTVGSGETGATKNFLNTFEASLDPTQLTACPLGLQAVILIKSISWTPWLNPLNSLGVVWCRRWCTFKCLNKTDLVPKRILNNTLILTNNTSRTPRPIASCFEASFNLKGRTKLNVKPSC